MKESRLLLLGALLDPKQELRSFLPRAVDVWRALSELGTGIKRPKTSQGIGLSRRAENWLAAMPLT